MSRETAEERALRAQLSELALAEGEPLTGGVPERWVRRPRFRCTNFHVADRYEVRRRGRMSCIFCELPVLQTFPEDRSGPLAPPQQGSAEPTGLPAQRTLAQVDHADRPMARRAQ